MEYVLFSMQNGRALSRVVLYVFNKVFYLALAFRICLPAYRKYSRNSQEDDQSDQLR